MREKEKTYSADSITQRKYWLWFNHNHGLQNTFYLSGNEKL